MLMSPELRAALALLFIGLTGPAPLLSQELVLTEVVDLPAADTLNLDPMRAPMGNVVPMIGGGWLYSGFLESWKWAEYDRNGHLLRAPGRRWAGGGPGEFRTIESVFPLQGDALLVMEPRVGTRVLEDGTYIDRSRMSLSRVFSWTRHHGEIWVGGYGLGASVAVGHVLPSGAVTTYTVVPQAPGVPGEAGSTTGHVVSWAGDLWVWTYPRGPLRRIDEESGRVEEEWSPFDDLQEDGSRAWAHSGPNGTVVFRRVVFQGDDHAQDWVVIDENRRMVTQIPYTEAGLQIVGPRFAWNYIYTDEPVRMVTGIRIFEYAFVN